MSAAVKHMRPDKPARAMTLIELLIVIAIISILTAGIGDIVLYSLRQEVHLQEDLLLQQQRDLVMTSLAIDASRALSITLKDNDLVFRTAKDGDKVTEIRYARNTNRLERFSHNIHGIETRQILSDRVEDWQAVMSGGICDVRLDLVTNRYRRSFRLDSRTLLGAGGAP